MSAGLTSTQEDRVENERRAQRARPTYHIKQSRLQRYEREPRRLPGEPGLDDVADGERPLRILSNYRIYHKGRQTHGKFELVSFSYLLDLPRDEWQDIGIVGETTLYRNLIDSEWTDDGDEDDDDNGARRAPTWKPIALEQLESITLGWPGFDPDWKFPLE